MKAHKVKPAQIICGSGSSNPKIPSGQGSTPPTPTNQGGNIGIYGESKGSSYDFEDDDF